MNTEQTQDKFEQIKGKLKETWGKLSDYDIGLYKDQRGRFLDKLKELYSLSREDAEKKVKFIENTCCGSATKAA